MPATWTRHPHALPPHATTRRTAPVAHHGRRGPRPAPSTRAIGLAISLLAAALPAQALTYVWSAPLDQTDWGDASRWSLLGVPGSNDTAIFNTTSGYAAIVNGQRAVGTLWLNGGRLTGSGTLDVGDLVFDGGTYGTGTATGGGTLRVSGNASFNALATLTIGYSQTLQLDGPASWGAGNGRISIDSAYTNVSGSFPAASLHIGSASVFTDGGAASPGSTKTLTNGIVTLDGRYVRNGLGTTVLSGLVANGQVQVNAGTLVLSGSNGGAPTRINGRVDVASGAELQFHYTGNADTSVIAGTVANAGLVRVAGGINVQVDPGAHIDGTWRLDGGITRFEGTHTIGALTVNGGWIGGNGTLRVSSLDWQAGTIGRTPNGGTLEVNGPAQINGASALNLDFSHILALNGNASWSAGNGQLVIASSYSNATNNFAAAQLRIGAGSTFNDLGAATAGGSKALGGGNYNVINDGTYQRNGLGTTWMRGLDNRGTLNVNSGTLGFEAGNWLNASSGQINVASGAELRVANASFTSGAVNNAGLVTVIGGDSSVAAAAGISGNWQLDAGRLFINGTQTIGALTVAGDGAGLGGNGTLRTSSLDWQAGTIGLTPNGGRLEVNGPAQFNGAAVLNLDDSHILALNGNASWTVGNGRLAVAGSYSNGNNNFAAAQLRINTGSTFSDLGTANAAGTRVLGSINQRSRIENAGTYLRTGLGQTITVGLQNQGLLDLREGTLSVDSSFSNTGTVRIASGAVLQADSGDFRNDGLITGIGTARTLSSLHALTNQGRIDPGLDAATAGELTVEGNLSFASGAELQIDLDASRHADLLRVTGNLLLGGTLRIGADSSLLFNVGDSFVIAHYAQRLNGSEFANVLWLGAGANPFTVEYGAQDLTLHVLGAVPEPVMWQLALLGGLPLVLALRRRRGLPASTPATTPEPRAAHPHRPPGA